MNNQKEKEQETKYCWFAYIDDDGIYEYEKIPINEITSDNKLLLLFKEGK